MSSLALQKWTDHRKPRLDAISKHYTDIMATSDEGLLDEHLRAYAMLLSAHFQGFCRDLHSDCVQVLTGKYMKLGLLFQMLTKDRELQKSNATSYALHNDFHRLGIDLGTICSIDSLEKETFDVRMEQLNKLIAWRNLRSSQRDRA